MNFLQPWAIWGLPLILLPVIIHLIHRRRQRVIEWGAMRFLFDKSRLSKGLQKLRHILILLARTAAVLGLVFALSRPLSSGFVGSVAGGGPDTVVCLIDRSSSMAHQTLGKSRVRRGIERLVPAIEALGAKKFLVYDGIEANPRAIDSPRILLDSPAGDATSSTSDVPGMFEKALAKVLKDGAGRTEIWISSDLQAADWKIESSRWNEIKKTLDQHRDTIAVRIVRTAEATPANYAVRVVNAEVKKTAKKSELSLDIVVTRDQMLDGTAEIPLTLTFSGARTTVPLTFSGKTLARDGVKIPLDGDVTSGFGKVELPPDDHPEDNVFYVTFGAEPPKKVIVVAEDETCGRILGLAAAAGTRDDAPVEVQTLKAEEAARLDLSGAALLLWQGKLPDPTIGSAVTAFAAAGGQAIFFPSVKGESGAALGIRFGAWQTAPVDQAFSPETWRDDADLWAKSSSGRGLPIGKLLFSSIAKLEGDGTVLARAAKGEPLFMRVTTSAGGIYALAGTPDPGRSNLATNGVVLIAMVQRALDLGVRSRRSGGQVNAGTDLGLPSAWKSLEAVRPDVLSVERTLHAGVLEKDERLVALNRPADEDLSPLLAVKAVREIFGDLPVLVAHSGDEDGGEKTLLEEIWRAFLVLVVAALFAEALLSLGDARPRVQA